MLFMKQPNLSTKSTEIYLEIQEEIKDIENEHLNNDNLKSDGVQFRYNSGSGLMALVAYGAQDVLPNYN